MSSEQFFDEGEKETYLFAGTGKRKHQTVLVCKLLIINDQKYKFCGWQTFWRPTKFFSGYIHCAVSVLGCDWLEIIFFQGANSEKEVWRRSPKR